MTVVITDSGRRVINRRGYPFAPSRESSPMSYTSSLPMVNGLTASYLRIVKTQPWVYIGINKRAKTVANLPIHVFSESEGDRERVRPDGTASGKLAGLFARPQPGVSAFEFKYGLEASLYTHGHWLAVKQVSEDSGVRGTSGLPTELWAVDWSLVEVIPGARTPVEAYVITVDGKRYPFTPAEVVHLQMWNGMSPLEPLRRTLAIEDATLRETQAAFENGVRPGGVFTSPSKLNADDMKAIRAQLEATYGGVDQAYKLAVIGGGLEWSPLSFSHDEAQLIPIRKLSREEVAAALDIPPPMIGILDHGTYSNYETAQRSFYMESIAPDLIRIEEGFETQLVQPEPEWSGLDLEFSMDEVMKSDLASRAEAYTKLTRVGFSIDEVRHLENMPPKDTALSKTSWVPQELMPTDADAMAEWQLAQAAKSPTPAPDNSALMAAALAMLRRDPEPTDDRNP